MLLLERARIRIAIIMKTTNNPTIIALYCVGFGVPPLGVLTTGVGNPKVGLLEAAAVN